MTASLCCYHLEPHDRIECRSQATESRPEPYPVLNIAGRAIFPSRDQLRRIRQAIDAYLAEEAAQDLGAGI
jgi:hypothetical protein